MKRSKPLQAKNVFGGAARKGQPRVKGYRRCKYNGYSYDSRAEARQAEELDWRLKADDIAGWERQYRVEIVIYDERGRRADTIRHKVDFRILHHDGSFELLEVKGFEGEDYKWRRRFLKAIWLPLHPDHRYTVVRA